MKNSFLHNFFSILIIISTIFSISVSAQNNIIDSLKIRLTEVEGEDKIKTLVNCLRRRGSHKVVWKGINREGGIVSSGLYFAKIVSANHNEVIKITFMQ